MRLAGTFCRDIQTICGFGSSQLRPIAAEQFGLLQNGLRGFFLLVRGIAVFAEDAADEDADLCLR